MAHLVVAEEADISLVEAEGEVHAADSLQVAKKENSVFCILGDILPLNKDSFNLNELH